MPDAIEPQLDEIRRRARRRLVGAIVLALAAAVLVPMLLESDPKPLGEDVLVKIPPVDEGKFVSKLGEKERAEVTPSVTAKSAPMAKSPDAATVASARDAGVTAQPPLKPPPKEGVVAPALATAPSGNPSSPPEPPISKAPAAPAQSADAATKPSGSAAFNVQLGAFADDKGANALANRLKKSGHPAYTEPYTTSRGTLWRVRVGPYATREAAEDARDKLKGEGQSGIIAAAS